jgi:hypothetical protein
MLCRLSLLTFSQRRLVCADVYTARTSRRYRYEIVIKVNKKPLNKAISSKHGSYVGHASAC